MLKDDRWKDIYEKFVHNLKNYEIGELLGMVKKVDEKSFQIREKSIRCKG